MNTALATRPTPTQPERLISVSFGPHSAEHLAWLAQIQQRFNPKPEQVPEPMKKAA